MNSEPEPNFAIPLPITSITPALLIPPITMKRPVSREIV